MPASLELQRELGDDLQVIFVEVQGATLDKAAAFALKRKWMGTRAMWTNEVMADPKTRSLPAFVLLGNEGQVLMQGNPLSKKSKIEKAIAEQIELTRQPPEGTPAELLPAWSEAAKGDFAAALEGVERVASGTDDPALAAAADAASKGIEARATRRLERVREMIAAGEFVFAEQMLERAAEGAAGNTKLEAGVKQVRAELESDELAAEREAALELAELVDQMTRGDPRSHADELGALVEKRAGTRAADRAARYLALLKTRV